MGSNGSKFEDDPTNDSNEVKQFNECIDKIAEPLSHLIDYVSANFSESELSKMKNIQSTAKNKQAVSSRRPSMYHSCLVVNNNVEAQNNTNSNANESNTNPIKKKKLHAYRNFSPKIRKKKKVAHRSMIGPN